MANRFTDTEKWKDEWFLSLEPTMKILWLYICDTCDYAGVWKVNFTLASFSVGTILDKQSALNAFGERVKVISDEKWHIPKFISFQYRGKLSPKNSAHRGVLKLLKFHGLETSPFEAPSEVLDSPSEGPKDKDKDKDSSFINSNKEELVITKPFKKPSPLSFLFGNSPQIQEWLDEGIHETHMMLLRKHSHHELIGLIEKAYAWAFPRGKRAETWLYTFGDSKKTAGYGANLAHKSFSGKTNTTTSILTEDELNEARELGIL